MTQVPAVHATRRMERTYAASPARVFQAWADPQLRRLWGTPSEEVEIRNDAADFRVGGEDIQSCLVGGEIVATVVGRYHDIEADRRIIYTEVISEAGVLLGVSLVSAEFLTSGTGTRLVLTLQTVAVEGSDFLEGVAAGWSGALDRLAQQIDAT
jgi:uncharacterized protein YndB with AHSA1/START domain